MFFTKNSTLKKAENLLEVLKSLCFNVKHKYPILDDSDIAEKELVFNQLSCLYKKLDLAINNYKTTLLSLETFKDTSTQYEYEFQKIYDNFPVLNAFYDVTCIRNLNFLPRTNLPYL